MDAERANEIAAAWLAGWNAHDLDGILAHYADELEFVSPLAVKRLGRADGRVTTKAELRDYFAPSLTPGSELRFELEAVFAGVGSINILYRNHRGQRVAETMFVNADGQVDRVYVHHGAEAVR
jgi:hypothetical protein